MIRAEVKVMVMVRLCQDVCVIGSSVGSSSSRGAGMGLMIL